jgi:hypothetical protein
MLEILRWPLSGLAKHLQPLIRLSDWSRRSGLCAVTWYEDGSSWKDLEGCGCSLNQARVLRRNLPGEAEEIHERMILLMLPETGITKWHPQFWEVSFKDLPITEQAGWSGNSPELYREEAPFESRLGHLLRSFIVFVSPSSRCWDSISSRGHSRFSEHPFQIRIH